MDAAVVIVGFIDLVILAIILASMGRIAKLLAAILQTLRSQQGEYRDDQPQNRPPR